MSTCKRNPTIEEYQNVFDTYPDYLKKVDDEGYIDDPFHDANHVQRDKNGHGDEVVRDAGITQEHMQRTKCLTHPFVCELRNA